MDGGHADPVNVGALAQLAVRHDAMPDRDVRGYVLME